MIENLSLLLKIGSLTTAGVLLGVKVMKMLKNLFSKESADVGRNEVPEVDHASKLKELIEREKKNAKIEWRKRVRVLFIDNDDFGIDTYLRRHDFNTFYLPEVKFFEIVEPFDIVIVDIDGIARDLYEQEQGYGFAKEIKSRYPDKVVIAYSSKPELFAAYAKESKILDDVIPKSEDPSNWVEILDDFIGKLIKDPDYKWEMISKKMMSLGITAEDLKSIEKSFENAYTNKKIDGFVNDLSNIANDSKVVIDIATQVLSFFSKDA